jgi:Flp pilus assembly protein TadD
MQPLPRAQVRFCRSLAAVALLVAVSAPAYAAEQCPIDDAAAAKAGGFPNAVTSAMKNEFSCEGAYRMLELCQLGSSGDNALSDIVLSKCEPRFLPKATAATKAAYEKARAKCSKIAEKNEGTMYQGQAAVCMARAGRDFARKYGTKS